MLGARLRTDLIPRSLSQVIDFNTNHPGPTPQRRAEPGMEHETRGPINLEHISQYKL
jgi:hypothetical protein